MNIVEVVETKARPYITIKDDKEQVGKAIIDKEKVGKAIIDKETTAAKAVTPTTAPRVVPPPRRPRPPSYPPSCAQWRKAKRLMETSETQTCPLKARFLWSVLSASSKTQSRPTASSDLGTCSLLPQQVLRR